MSLWRLPAGVNFAQSVASVLLKRAAESSDHGLSLPDTLLLLPTRRACRTMKEAFLRASAGAPLLLPRLMALGDLDADDMQLSGLSSFGDGLLTLPPAIDPLRRQLLLAQLVGRLHGDWTTAHCIAMSQALARLMDDMTLEGIAPDGLDGLADELSAHWDITLSFLKQVFAAWPAILADEGVLDPSQRLIALLTAQTKLWQAQPPAFPVIVAGSLGTLPAIQTFMKTVQALPRSEVILPSLCSSQESAGWWDEIDSTHPFKSLKALVKTPDEAALWPAQDPLVAPARRALLHTALLPAASTALWSDLPQKLKDSCAQGTEGLMLAELPTEQAEALTIATFLRAALDAPTRTAMLVTPSRDLGRRVAAELQRWGVVISDSAGTPLLKTPSAIFLRLLLKLAADFSPASLLAVLKHPLAGTGLAPADCRRRARALERKHLRGISRSALPDFDALSALLATEEELRVWSQHLQTLLHPLTTALQAKTQSLTALLETLVRVAESVASTTPPTEASNGAARVWRGDDGRALADWVASVLQAAKDFPPIPTRHAPEALVELMAGKQVRSQIGQHPRLSILGPMEAQLQQADWVVLGGLNEGTWPAPPKPDPWMSRPMRKRLGLKPTDERIGQQAHDFYTLAAAPYVLITRATRQGGTPTVPSRWLQRLENVLSSLSLSAPHTKGEAWAALASQLDRTHDQTPAIEPRPCPPVAVRPKRLSVTDVEKLQIDPYSIYAKHILRLLPLDDLEPMAGAAERGILYHAIAKRFVQTTQHVWPDDPFAHLMALADAEMSALHLDGEKNIWRPHLEKMAHQFIAAEVAHRATGATPLAQETKGRMSLTLADDTAFTLTAQADRIDLMPSGALAIIDYKTGSIPTPTDRLAGYSLQLPLEALIARHGTFAEVPAARDTEVLQYWQLKGSTVKSVVSNFISTSMQKETTQDTLIQEAQEKLHALLNSYQNLATPYLCEPDLQHTNKFSDYRHLARHAEWAQQTTEDDGDEGTARFVEDNAS